MTLEADLSAEAQRVVRGLPQQIAQASVMCPLCGATMPVRGLRAKALMGQERIWQVAFTCPACGLVSTFAANNISLKQLGSLHGSAWTNELRQYRWFHKAGAMPFSREAGIRHFVGVVVISFLTWMVLIGNLNPLDVLWGLVVSIIVARLSYRFVVFELPRWVTQPRRWVFFLDLMVEFIRQLIIQNVTLSIRVFRPDLPIRPGIVAVPMKLRGDVNLTILGSLMTLTPDTVTIDMDTDEGMVYMHWIEVKTTDQEMARRLLVADLEDRIIRWLL